MINDSDRLGTGHCSPARCTLTLQQIEETLLSIYIGEQISFAFYQGFQLQDSVKFEFMIFLE